VTTAEPEPPRDPAELRDERNRLRRALGEEKARGVKLRDAARQLERRIGQEKDRSRAGAASVRK
jgi:hypothetical protein